VKDFKELNVWKKAHRLTLDRYQAIREFPREEIYGLTGQMRRAAVSIAASIAEGCGRRSDGELTRFLQIARGSASELEYHLLLSRDLQFLTEDHYLRFERELNAVQRMLTALVQRVQPLASSRQSVKSRRNSLPVARS
jgi:four helix bundle protein